MEITEVRVAVRDSPEKRLRGYATLTFDHCFVVRNIKIIEGKQGLFVAMPSHKPKVTCARCHAKSDVGARYCGQCGSAITRSMAPTGDQEVVDPQAHRDIAHPITVEFRQYLQEKVLEAYEAERVKAQAAASSSS